MLSVAMTTFGADEVRGRLRWELRSRVFLVFLFGFSAFQGLSASVLV